MLSPAYRRYALGLLLVVYIFNFVDRSILYILLESIKNDLQLSDAYLGILGGFAFALIYTFMGIPIARLADLWVRRSIIALGLALWSAMTALTGFSGSALQLVMARMGVGLGESACSPPSHSLISDYFPPERRATAMSIYSLGIPIGSAVGSLVGGWVNQWYGWRAAFLWVGLPGILLALVVWRSLREPPRGLSETQGAGRTGATAGAPTVGAGEPLRIVLRYMVRLRSFRHMSLGAALHAFYGYGAGAFLPAFFIRLHGFETGELGTWFFAFGITFGPAGTFLGGWLSDRLAVRDRRWYVWLPALATATGIPFSILLYLWPDGHVALLLSIPGSILGGMWLGPTFAMTQGLVKLRMRATASAILLFVINLIGMGGGPYAVGLVSDWLHPSLGVESIRWALLSVVTLCAAWSSLHYLIAARTLRRDLAAASGT